jgi:hypothetical protein
VPRSCFSLRLLPGKPLRHGTAPPFCIKDVEDQAALAEREALERVSQVEAENSAAPASIREDAAGLAQKIALHEDNLARERRAREMSEREHRVCFEELTLL